MRCAVPPVRSSFAACIDQKKDSVLPMFELAIYPSDCILQGNSASMLLYTSCITVWEEARVL